MTNNFDYTSINKSRASNEPEFRDDLGALCHFNQFKRSVPIFVITDLKGNIICSNNVIKPNSKKPNVITVNNKIVELQAKLDKELLPINQGGLTDDQANKLKIQIYDLKESIKDSNPLDNFVNEWLISGVKSTVTRFFSCSTATVMLTCDVSDQSMYTPLIPEALQQERDICVWGGFIESIRPVTKDDLTKNLLRIFVGIIDTIQFTGSGTGGYTISLSCRDRLKWLMDTSNTFDIGSIQGDTISRSQLILQIAQKGIGFVEEPNSQTEQRKGENKSLKRIITKKEGQYIHDLAESSKTKPLAGLTDVPSFELIYNSDPFDNTKNGPLAGNTTCKLEVERDPAFYIYTSRVGISTQNTAQLMIRQQHPIDMIKTLTMQEVYPTDMFQSHVDGNFYYYPRAADFNSLNDPKRYFRTYFFRTTPSLQQKDLLQYKGYPVSIKIDDNTVFETNKVGNFQLNRTITKSAPIQGPVDTRPNLSGSELSLLNSKLNNVDQSTRAIKNGSTVKFYVKNYDTNYGFYITFKGQLGINGFVDLGYGKSQQGESQNILTAPNTGEIALPYVLLKVDIPANRLAEIGDKLVQINSVNAEEYLKVKENSQITFAPNFSIANPSFRSGFIYLEQETSDLGNVTDTNVNVIPMLPPDPNQMLVSLRYEQSSIGVFTNFILYKSNTADQLVTTEWTMHLELIPEAFYGRDGKQIPIANKFVRIEDPNVKTPAEGAAVLLNAARVYARATQVASIVLNGDVSITPGEIFQVFGSPILDNDGLPKLLEDRNNYLKMKTLSIQSFKSLALATTALNKESNGTPTEATDNINANILNNPTNKATVTPENYDKLSASDKEKYIQVKLYNGSTLIAGLDNGKTGDKAVTSDDIITKTSNTVTRGTDIIPEPKTIFRCEAVAHKYNIGGSRGFVTEVSLTVPV